MINLNRISTEKYGLLSIAAPARALKMEILKMPYQCENNDFLPNTISYVDNVKGIEIQVVENRKQMTIYLRNKCAAKTTLIDIPVFSSISCDEWIAQNYLEKTMENQS